MDKKILIMLILSLLSSNVCAMEKLTDSTASHHSDSDSDDNFEFIPSGIQQEINHSLSNTEVKKYHIHLATLEQKISTLTNLNAKITELQEDIDVLEKAEEMNFTMKQEVEERLEENSSSELRENKYAVNNTRDNVYKQLESKKRKLTQLREEQLSLQTEINSLSATIECFTAYAAGKVIGSETK